MFALSVSDTEKGRRSGKGLSLDLTKRVQELGLV